MVVYDRPDLPEWMRYHAVMTPNERVYVLAALQAMVEELSKIKKKTHDDELHLRAYRTLVRRYNRPQLQQKRETNRPQPQL